MFLHFIWQQKWELRVFPFEISPLKNSGYRRSEDLCIKWYFLVLFFLSFEPSKVRNGLLSCLDRVGCVVVHAETHTVWVLFVFQQEDLQQHRLPLPVLCTSVFWPQRKGAPAAPASHRIQVEAWNPARNNRAILLRFLSWKTHFAKNLKSFIFASIKAPGRRILKSQAGALVQRSQLAWWQISLVQIPDGERGRRRHHNPLTRQVNSWSSSALLVCIPRAVGSSYAHSLSMEP